MRRALAGGILLALLAAGCSEAQQVTGKAADCAALARDAVNARSNVRSVSQLEEQVRRLDDRIRTIDDADVRAAAERLRDAARRLIAAVRAGDPGATDRATREVRDAAGRTARACNLPVDRFTG